MQIRILKLMAASALCYALLLSLAARGAKLGGEAAQPQQAAAIRLVPQVDERVELLSIVFHLAGNPDLLREYESNRSQYPTFDSFVPQAGRFYETLAGKMASEIAAYKQSCPHVVGMSPFPNHSQDVDPSIKQLTVEFDKPLKPTQYSINLGAGGKDHFPVTGSPQFLTGDKVIVLAVVLKPGWSYSFVLSGFAFASQDGYPLEEYEVSFKTR